MIRYEFLNVLVLCQGWKRIARKGKSRKKQVLKVATGGSGFQGYVLRLLTADLQRTARPCSLTIRLVWL
jgi:hypothetical protein